MELEFSSIWCLSCEVLEVFLYHAAMWSRTYLHRLGQVVERPPVKTKVNTVTTAVILQHQLKGLQHYPRNCQQEHFAGLKLGLINKIMESLNELYFVQCLFESYLLEALMTWIAAVAWNDLFGCFYRERDSRHSRLPSERGLCFNPKVFTVYLSQLGHWTFCRKDVLPNRLSCNKSLTYNDCVLLAFFSSQGNGNYIETCT